MEGSPLLSITRDEALRVALLGRPDVRAGLADYAAAEAALRLELARQVPDLHVGTGYTFDQGQNKWALGLSVVLPLVDRNEGPIAEAEAARQEAAAKFVATQAQAIAEVEQALARRTGALAQRERLGLLAADRRENLRRLRSALELGAADRASELTARLEEVRAERALLDAETNLAQALGDLEAALQAPLPAQDPEARDALVTGPGRRIGGALLAALVAAAAGCSAAREPETGSGAPSREVRVEGARISLGAGGAARLGLEVAPVAAAQASVERSAFGRVLDPLPLVEPVLAQRAARDALEQARSEYARARGLHEHDRNASTRDVEVARLAFERAALDERLAAARVAAAWGPVAADRGDLEALAGRLAAGTAALGRLDLPVGEVPGSAPESVALSIVGRASAAVTRSGARARPERRSGAPDAGPPGPRRGRPARAGHLLRGRHRHPRGRRRRVAPRVGGALVRRRSRGVRRGRRGRVRAQDDRARPVSRRRLARRRVRAVGRARGGPGRPAAPRRTGAPGRGVRLSDAPPCSSRSSRSRSATAASCWRSRARSRPGASGPPPTPSSTSSPTSRRRRS